MGKNYKEKQAFLYLHNLSDSVSISVKNKWDRKNYDVGKSRAKRKKVIEQDIDKMSKY